MVLRCSCQPSVNSRTNLELVDADDGEEAAAVGTLLAVTEEEVGAAGRAEIADEDV